MLTLRKIITSSIFLFLAINAKNGHNNHSNKEKVFFGTKSPYRLISNKNDSKIEFQDCKPIKLWMLVRHGTRNPNAKLIKEMMHYLPALRDEIIKNNPHSTEYLKDSDLDAFRKWKCTINEAQEKELVNEGEIEMIQLAKRMQSRFPNLLPTVYSNSTFKFKFTATQRTEKSAKSFAAGLFGWKIVDDVWFPKPLQADPILRFYKLCKKWKRIVKKNSKTSSEKILFESSEHVQRIIRDITKRLSLSTLLSLENIHVIYMTCAFETAWNEHIKSPWCTPFTEESFKVKEYIEDLRYYWEDGYGHELTYKQACPAFKDMIDFFENTDTQPKSVVYFTHSGTLLKMLAHLGLYQDETPLKHEDFTKENRLWHVSKIDAFATNLAFVLFHCDDGKKCRRKIAVMHQEQIIELPSCPYSSLCNMEKVMHYYSESINSCDFNNMCT